MTTTTNHDALLQACEPYILNDLNMSSYLKYNIVIDNTPPTKKHISTPKEELHQLYFVPSQTDTLFWCHYILRHGQLEYELLQHKTSLAAKQIKIQYVQQLRDNKTELKMHKLDSLAKMESNLVNDDIIHIKTFMALCVLDGVHAVFIRKKAYFELENKSKSGTICFIKEMPSRRYGIYIDPTDSFYQNIQGAYYKMVSLDKPIKAVASYKVEDLKQIAIKLAVDSNGKTKTELYESIMHYFF